MSSVPRVLVVDDSKVDRELISGLLEAESGLQVETAAGGREALERIARSPPDLLVTDLAMPDMSGLELVERVAGEHPSIPIVLVTSQGSEEAASRALRLGATSYVRKADLATDLAEVADSLLATILEQRARRGIYAMIESSRTVFRLPNDRESFPPVIAFALELIEGIGLLDEADLMRVGVALEEAMVNAAEHGNLEMDSDLREHDRHGYLEEVQRRRETEPWSARTVLFVLELSPEEVRLHVGDEGSGFDPSDLPDPKDPKNILKASGRGVLLMRTFVDEVRYNEKGNEVTLIKRRPAS